MTEPGIDLGIEGLGPATPIGSGGFATVYRARQERLNRTVAVKVMNVAPNEATMRRFEREVQAIGSMSDHPGIVTIYAASSVRGLPYLIMQLCSEGSLKDGLRRSGPYDAYEACELVAPIARTLALAHDRGIVHRDIKPDNVLIGSHGEPLIADFGIAALQDRTGGVSSNNAFTPSYAAPEVFDNPPAAPADVYALGATLYELTTGIAPYNDPSDTDNSVHKIVLKLVRGERPTDPSAFGVPDDVAAIIRSTMDHDPALRPSARELAGQLEALLAERTRAESVRQARAEAEAAMAEVRQQELLERDRQEEARLAEAEAEAERVSAQLAAERAALDAERAFAAQAAAAEEVANRNAEQARKALEEAEAEAERAAEAARQAKAEAEAERAAARDATARAEAEAQRAAAALEEAERLARTTTDAAPTAAPTVVTESPNPPSRSRRALLGAGALVALAGLAVAGWFFFIKPDRIVRDVAIESGGADTVVPVVADANQGQASESAPAPTPAVRQLAALTVGEDGDYATIAAALEVAEVGDTIVLGDGTHIIEERLVLNDRIEIVGQGPASVVRVTAPVDRSLFVNAEGVILRDFVLEHDAESGDASDLLFVNGGDFLIERLTVRNAARNGVVVAADSGRIVETTARDNGFRGFMFVTTAAASVESSTATGNGGSGFAWIDTATGSATSNVSSMNALDGFLVAGSATPTLIDNTAAENLQGFAIGGMAAPITSGNRADNNVEVGYLWAFEAGGQSDANTATGNGRSGFVIAGSTTTVFDGNVSNDNGQHGFWVSESSTATLNADRATGNGLSGFSVAGSATTTLQNTVASENTEHGYRISDESTAVLNVLLASRNGVHGVSVSGNAVASIEAGTATTNGGVGFGARESAELNVSNSTAERNVGSGYYLEDESSGRVTDNVAEWNGGRGYRVVGSAHPDLLRNDSKSNADGDFSWTANAGGHFCRNTALRAQRFNWGEVDTVLRNEDC